MHPGIARAATLLSLTAAVLTGCGERAQHDAHPSILLVSIDTLRADHLGCYGYAPYVEPVSPAIDALARNGARFTAAYAPRGQTAPSLCSLMTGKYPSAHGVRENGQAFAPGQVTLFQHLGRLGYTTRAFISQVPASAQGHPAQGAARTVMGTATADGTRVETQAESDALVARAFEAWLERWQRTRARPFFAWVHFYDVHKPYAPPADCGRAFVGDYRGRLRGASDDELGAVIDHSTLARQPLDDADRRYVLALYDGAIRCIDDHVARMLAALDRHGLADTMVIVTSDHGEELGDHHHYYYHGNSVYGSTLRVPLVIRWPGRVPAGRTIEQLTQNVDLLPTILDLLGAPVPPDVEGVSVAGLLTGEDAGRAAPRQAVFTEWQNLIVGVRTPRFSYVLNPTGAHPKKPPFYGAHTRGFPVECEELYALDEDPAEQRNRHGELADIEASLRAQAMDFRERSGVVSDWQSVEDAAVVQNLEALGYVATTRTRDDVIVGAVRCR